MRVMVLEEEYVPPSDHRALVASAVYTAIGESNVVRKLPVARETFCIAAVTALTASALCGRGYVLQAGRCHVLAPHGMEATVGPHVWAAKSRDGLHIGWIETVDLAAQCEPRLRDAGVTGPVWYDDRQPAPYGLLYEFVASATKRAWEMFRDEADVFMPIARRADAIVRAALRRDGDKV